MITKKIYVIISLILLITGCSHISTVSYQEFNANEIIQKNELYKDDVPILVLLQNDDSSLITIVSQAVKKDTYYFRLDTDIDYNILMKDNIIYIQNNNYCFVYK